MYNETRTCAWCGKTCETHQRYCSRRCQVARRNIDPVEYKRQLDEDSSGDGPPPLMLSLFYAPLLFHILGHHFVFAPKTIILKILLFPWTLCHNIPVMIWSGLINFLPNDGLGFLLGIGLWILVCYSFCLAVTTGWIREAIGTTIGIYLPGYAFFVGMFSMSFYAGLSLSIVGGYLFVRIHMSHLKVLINSGECFLYYNPFPDWKELNFDQKALRLIGTLICRY